MPGSKGQAGITWQLSHLGVQVKKMFDEKSSSVTRLLEEAAASERLAPLPLRGNLPKAGNSLVLNLLQFLPFMQKPNVRYCLGENINNIKVV